MRLLLAAAGLAQGLYGVQLVRKLAARVIIVAMLAIASAILGSAFIVGAFYVLYIILLTHGVGLGASIAITGVCMALVTFIIIGLTLLALQRLRWLPHILLHKSAFTGVPVDAIEAFVHGFVFGRK